MDTVIRDLSRQALRLNGKAPFDRVLDELSISHQTLTQHFNSHAFRNHPAFNQIRTDELVNTHPITRLLVMKLRNISCPMASESYYQTENIVKDLAHLEE